MANIIIFLLLLVWLIWFIRKETPKDTTITPPVTTPLTEPSSKTQEYSYVLKKSLMTATEIKYWHHIQSFLPDGYFLFPQINLASIITKVPEDFRHNELFRNVDFLITNSEFQPLLVIEINDKSHLDPQRRKRDEKVKSICSSAGIPLQPFVVDYGLNKGIENKILACLKSDTEVKIEKRLTHQYQLLNDEDQELVSRLINSLATKH